MYSLTEKSCDYFTEKTNNGWSCNTGISYNCSVTTFAKFVQVSHFEHYFNSNKTDLPTLKVTAEQTSKACLRWIKSYNRKGRVAYHQREEDVREHLITREKARTVRYGAMTEISQLVERMIISPMSSDSLSDHDQARTFPGSNNSSKELFDPKHFHI